MIKLKSIYIEGNDLKLQSFLKDFKAELGEGINVITLNAKLDDGFGGLSE